MRYLALCFIREFLSRAQQEAGTSFAAEEDEEDASFFEVEADKMRALGKILEHLLVFYPDLSKIIKETATIVSVQADRLQEEYWRLTADPREGEVDDQDRPSIPASLSIEHLFSDL